MNKNSFKSAKSTKPAKFLSAKSSRGLEGRKAFESVNWTTIEKAFFTPEQARVLTLGRGICLDPDTLEKAIDATKGYLNGLEYRQSCFMLKLRRENPNIPEKDLIRVFGLEWKTCTTPVSFPSGKQLFKNECSFILSNREIFLPGAFPVVELGLYTALGKALCEKCVHFSMYCD